MREMILSIGRNDGRNDWPSFVFQVYLFFTGDGFGQTALR